MPAPAVPKAPWNVNAPEPCPNCMGRGCKKCDWTGSLRSFLEKSFLERPVVPLAGFRRFMPFTVCSN